LQVDHPERLPALGDDERRAARLRDAVDRRADDRGQRAVLAGDEALDRVDGTLADRAAVEVDAAHARLRGERDEGRAELVDAPLAQAVLLLGEHDDAAPL